MKKKEDTGLRMKKEKERMALKGKSNIVFAAMLTAPLI